MGPRQSVHAQPDSASNTPGQGSRGVRTGAYNSALVQPFGLFPVGAEGPSHSSTTPRVEGGGTPGSRTTPRTSSSQATSGDSQEGGYQPVSTTGIALQDDQLHLSHHEQAELQLQQAARKKAAANEPSTAQLCLRYKFQVPKQHQTPTPSNQKQVPLPPQPQQAVSVDLFDGEGKQLSNIPLNSSDGEFYSVVSVPMPRANEKPLTQYFRFNVDGRRAQCHPHLPSSQMPNGEVANFVTVHNAEVEAAPVEQQQQQSSSSTSSSSQQQQSAIDDESGWSQQPPQFEETRKFPPIMPPHLRYTPLNAPPSQYRCDLEGNVVPESLDDVVIGPEQRPAPLSVTINHFYFQRREDHTLVGMTTRYQDKCTSIAYYKHDPLPAGAVAVPTGAIPMHLPR